MGSLKKAASYICFVSCRSCFFVRPSFFCIAVAIRTERLGIVFSIPRQLERVTGCLAIGPAGEKQMVQFSCHPVCLAEMSGSKWRRVYSHILNICCIYMCMQMHTQIGFNAYAVTHVCVESFRTHFFHLHWRFFLDALIQRHFNRAAV